MDDFIAVIKELESALELNEYIGIHCTHGKNRTGYMIVNYMSKEKGVEVEEAIAAFERSRHPMKIDK